MKSWIVMFRKTSRESRIFWFAMVVGGIVRLIWAPLTSYSYDIGAFLKHDELFYLAHVTPLYWWSYGATFLGILLGFFPLKLIINALGVDNIMVTHLALKLPFLLADFGIAVLLSIIVNRLRPTGVLPEKWQKTARAVAAMWWLNPFVIFVSAIHGMFDALPMFFVLFAVVFVLRNRVMWAYAFLALATTIKLFPLFLFPFFFLFLWPRTTFRTQVQGILVAATIGIASFLPLLFPETIRESFIDSLFFHTSGVISDPSAFSIWRVFFDSQLIDILSASWIPRLFFLVFLPSWAALMVKSVWDIRKKNSTPERFLTNLGILLILLLPYNTGNVIQYVLWPLPFILVWIYVYRRTSPIALGLLIAAVFVHFFSGTSPFLYFLNTLPNFGSQTWPLLNNSLNILMGFIASLIFLWIAGDALKNIHQKIPVPKAWTSSILMACFGLIAATVAVMSFVIFSVSYRDLRLPPVEIFDRDRFFNYIHEPIASEHEGNQWIYAFNLPEVSLLNSRAWDASFTVVHSDTPLSRFSNDEEVDQQKRHALSGLSFRLREKNLSSEERDQLDRQFENLAEGFIPFVTMTVDGQSVPIQKTPNRPILTIVRPRPSEVRSIVDHAAIPAAEDVLKPTTTITIQDPTGTWAQQETPPVIYLETQIHMAAVDPWYQSHWGTVVGVSILMLLVVAILGFLLYREKKYAQ